MTTTEPETELAAVFSDPAAEAVPWAEAEQVLAAAEVGWLSTVRPDGRPHVTTLLYVWRDGAAHICTGEQERKARNIAGNPHVVLTTGKNALKGGIDIVVESTVERVTDPATLRTLAAAWEEKYGADWHFDVVDGGFSDGSHGLGLVYRLAPTKAFGFGKDPYSQTRWSF